MQYFYDVRGNLLLVRDPYQRNVFEHKYDLRAAQKGDDGKQQALPPIWTKHIDKGESTILFDAVGKAIEGFDAKGAHTLSAYDVISRPVYSWASNKTGDTITLRGKTIYGETFGTASDNLKGKVYQSYDEAGKITFGTYDFKGNLLTKTREVFDDSVLQTALSSYQNFIVNWASPPALLANSFESDMAYDALNRVRAMTLPLDLEGERKQFLPTYNSAGALEKVDLVSTLHGTTNYVENIAYNAKGQRLLIAFGNSRMTRYTYDARTFRLLRQKTEGFTKTSSGGTVTYAYNSGTNKQDDGFNYDLVGNIVNIFNRVKDCGIGGNPDELDRDFEYDSIYRLTYANGRESNTQSGNNYLYVDAPVGNYDPSAVRYYERSYSYDKLGNVNSLVQAGTNGFTRNYSYNTGYNTLQRINDGSGVLIESYSYDACGNTISTNLNRRYAWNHADQLLCYKNQVGSSDPTVFTQYDYAGHDRVSKLVRTGTAGAPIFERTIYIDGVFEYVKLQSAAVYEKNYIHIMDDTSRIAELRINVGLPFPGDIADDLLYVLEDQIGSSVTRLDANGTVIDQEEYYPFGDSSLRTFTYKRYRYVGKERDAESGLYYYGARYYAAWTCRFINVDPLAANYAHLSPYNYASNNPITHIDVDGMQNPAEGTSEKGGNPPPKGSEKNPVILPEVEVFGTKIENPLAASTGNPAAEPDNCTNISTDPKIITRSEWGAKPADTSKGYESIPTENLSVYYNSIVLHHTGNSDNNPTPNDIQNEQMDQQYADVAYNYMIDSEGNIYEGRPLDKMEAHVKGTHHGLIGIALLGDFDSKDSGLSTTKKLADKVFGDTEVTPKMLDALFSLVKYLNDTYGIDYLGGHKEFHSELNPNSVDKGDNRYCPGFEGMDIVKDLRNVFKFAPPSQMTTIDKNWYQK